MDGVVVGVGLGASAAGLGGEVEKLGALDAGCVVVVGIGKRAVGHPFLVDRSLRVVFDQVGHAQ